MVVDVLWCLRQGDGAKGIVDAVTGVTVQGKVALAVWCWENWA